MSARGGHEKPEEVLRRVRREVEAPAEFEEALFISEERYRILAEHASDLIMQHLADGRAVYVSPACGKLMGYEPGELLGRNLYDLVHPEDLPRARSTHQAIVRFSKSPTVCLRMRRKDGTYAWFESSTQPILRPGARDVQGFISISRDVTEQKQAEAALKESEYRYRDLFENANDLILVLSPKGRILNANMKWKETLGYTQAETDRLFIFDVIDPQFLPRCREILRQILEGQSASDLEIVFQTKEREPIPVEGSANCRFEDGKPILCRCIFRDIRERKKGEEERRRLQARLRQAHKMEAVATLAGGVAHQFNNALSGISASADLLELAPSAGENVRKYTRIMREAVQRMVKLNNQLLAYARGGRYEARVLPLSEFVRTSFPLVEHAIDSGIEVSMDLPADMRCVDIDLAQMQMVLTAILKNASEALEGRGRIRISVQDRDIDENQAARCPGMSPGAYACLIVEDEGRGMDEKTRNRVFEPFFSTKFQGRGLGMAAAYGIVKNHGGWISVESEPEKGTRVTIYLPASQKGLSGPEVPESAAPRKPGTILMIEDEEMILEVNRMLLEHLGYRVLVARTGREALSVAREYSGEIDVALLDVILPDMSGKEVYPRLMEARPRLKVIVCSGYSLDGPARDIMADGAEAFLQKPFSMKTLQTEMKALLNPPQGT